MEENYFFVIEDIDKNRLPSLQGTWKLYCSENERATISNSVLIQQSEFTTDEFGGVFGPKFEIEEKGRVTELSIIPVDNSFNSAFLLIEVDGYRRTIESVDLTTDLNPILIDNLIISTSSDFEIQLLNEVEYIQDKIDTIKQRLQERLIPQFIVETPPALM